MPLVDRSATIDRFARAALCCVLLALSACDTGLSDVSASLEVADKGAFSAALSLDGRLLAIGSLTHGGSLWQLETKERLFNWNHRAGEFSPLTALAISPDGGFALSAESESLVLWNTTSGAALTFFNAPSLVLAMALGPGARVALLGLSDGSAVVFDPQRGGILRTLEHRGRVRSVALDQDARYALTGSDDQSARLWEVATGKELQRWLHDGEVRLVALSPDGSRALSTSKYDRSVVWDTQTGLESAEVPVSRWRIARGETFTAAAFSADASVLLTGTSNRTVQRWELPAMRRSDNWQMPLRADWKRSGAYVMTVGFSETDPGLSLGVSADGFIHQLRRAR